MKSLRPFYSHSLYLGQICCRITYFCRHLKKIFLAFDFSRFCVVIRFFIPVTTASLV